NKIAEAYEKNISLENLLLAPYFMKEIERNKHLWKTLIARSITEELPLPAMASGFEYFIALTTGRSGANMIQAQRDYFGAHTFERTDQPRGIFFHINWTGKGGETQSGSYNA
ncbi:MAG: NADP-dependent phosphogluconate dehydrogenase, partial [Bacteroidales bacterium]